MYFNSKLKIIDNTGARLLKLIGIYKFNNVFTKVASIFVSSLSKVTPRRKLKTGSIFRAYTVRARFPTYRLSGLRIFSSASRSMLFKNLDNVPVANRVKGYLLIEVFSNFQVVFPAITIYTVLNMYFSKFDNLALFSNHLLKSKFFYRSSCDIKNFNFNLSRFRLPISGAYKKKSLISFWEIFRTFYYSYKIYNAFKPTSIFLKKHYYTFELSIYDQTYISSLLSFVKKFKKRHPKLFSRFYLSSNFSNFSFYFRDSHLFSSLNHKVFDYYSWKTRVSFNFQLPAKSSKKSLPKHVYKEFYIDYTFFFLFYIFNFSNKKFLCVIFYLHQRINEITTLN
jgi:ribosomal protein L14